MHGLRQLLGQEFLRRTQTNFRYSLRAFAKQLNLNHGTLSRLMSGKRKITHKTIEKLQLTLELTPAQADQFRRECGSGSKTSEKLQYTILQQNYFQAISVWYFDAIIEMTKIPRIRLSAPVVSKALGIGSVQAKSALELLTSLDFLVSDARGNFRAQARDTTNIISADFTSAANRSYQRSVLLKSIEALEQIDIRQRDHSSVTLAINHVDLPRAKKLMKKFRREFDALFQSEAQNFDEVYQLQMSFFPLTNFKRNAK